MKINILLKLYEWIRRNLKALDPHEVSEFHEILKAAMKK